MISYRLIYVVQLICKLFLQERKREMLYLYVHIAYQYRALHASSFPFRCAISMPQILPQRWCGNGRREQNPVEIDFLWQPVAFVKYSSSHALNPQICSRSRKNCILPRAVQSQKKCLMVSKSFAQHQQCKLQDMQCLSAWSHIGLV